MATKNVFKVSEEVMPLDYDLCDYDDDGNVTVERPKGRIPEPSHQQMKTFRKAIGAIYKTIGDGLPDEPEGTTTRTPAEQMHYLSDRLEEDDSELRDEIADALSGIAHIDKQLLLDLPDRYFRYFMGWLTEVFLLAPNS